MQIQKKGDRKMKLCLACFKKCADESVSCPYCGHGREKAPGIKNSLPLGTQIFKRFKLGKAIDSDGKFITYYGLDQSTNRRVKITEYVPQNLISGRCGQELLYKNETSKARADRFAAEFSYNCKRICKANENGIFDIIFCESLNSTFYYVSLFPVGTPLSSIIGNGKKLGCAEAAEMLTPVASSLDKLHAEGMLHGGIKPYNIICRNGKAVLLANTMQLSANASSYDAPELNSETVSERCDVYSLAAVFYEAVTGYAPPTAQFRKSGVNLSSFNKLPAKTADALTKALDLSPENRFASAGKLIAAAKSKAKPTAKKEKGEKKKLPASEILRRTVLAISCVCLVASLAYLLFYYIIEPYLSDRQDKELSGMLTEESADVNYWENIKEKYPDIVFPDGMNPSFADLYAINDEIAGWVRIPELKIDFPVMQADDNDKYLKTDFYGKRTNYGETFFDYRNNLDTLDRNTIIYGHNMRHDDKVFGTLEQYRKPEGFEKAPLIEMHTLSGVYKFKVYAAFVTNALPGDDNGHVFNYIFTQTDNYSFLNYVSEIDKRKFYSTGVDINSEDKILTLSTCCYDFEDARLVVVARLIRDGESASVDTSLAVINDSPKFPQAYYDAKGKTNPYRKDPDLFES